MLKVKTSYTPEISKLETYRAALRYGSGRDEFFPYDLLLGALSACFYATLRDILEKQKAEIPSVEITITGEKRTEVPTTLKWVNMEINVKGEVNQKQFSRAVDLAAKYCSIHETISKVAVMSHEVHFEGNE